MVTGSFGSSALLTMLIAFEMAPNRVQLSLSEDTIAALHKAGLKGPAIARETGHPLPTLYGVLKRFKQRGTVENKARSGRTSLLTPWDTRKLYGVVKSERKRPLRKHTIFSMRIELDLYLIELFKENCMKQNITSVL
jgi:hypothetical protein